jgi:pimeloyl-ACP methyl ester carboxylesterase
MRRLLPALLLLLLAVAGPAQGAGRLVEIGGGKGLYLDCRGAGSPTVLLEAGLRVRGDSWNFADDEAAIPTYQAIGARTRVCEYDRPGTSLGPDLSRSTPVRQPRRAQRCRRPATAAPGRARAGPYVVVARSTGGLFAQLFTASYPDDVVGLVLVDTVPPGLRRLMGTEWPFYRKATSPPHPRP